MGLDFRLRDFAYPWDILKLKLDFDRHPYLPPAELQAYQLSRFRAVVTHAYEKVPYYRKLFDTHGLDPAALTSLADASALPCLTKEALAQSFDALTASDAALFAPVRLHTSGTTGGRVGFLVDRSSNVLEFVYYWRLWGWHGYRLGDRFAELSAESFLPIEKHANVHYTWNPFLNRVLVNSLLLSPTSIGAYVDLFEQARPLFLKGLPSNLYVLALLCDRIKQRGIRFRAIFAQGENLYPHQRKLIEEVFSSPVFDCYGHLERTVAISQCPAGRYHIHSDYGLVELLPATEDRLLPVELLPGQAVAEVVGTSLHNRSMPLIRYRSGDLVVTDTRTRCPCGRTFPLVHAIVGRSTDVVVTPDQRAITALYVALDRIPDLVCGQIVQPSLDTLLVKVVAGGGDRNRLRETVVRTIHAFTGNAMRVVVEERSFEELRPPSGKKLQTVVSHLDVRALLG